jgi:YD repeat-containing protein
MSVLEVTISTSLPAAEVLRILTDFEGRRSAAWRGVDDKHFAVHDVGDDWADVTEGNAFAWERERYQWDAAGGTVSVTTTDSNLWGPGSGWEYRLTPTQDGSELHVRAIRNPKNLRGRVVVLLLRPFGKKFTAGNFSRALAAGA